MQPSYVPPGPHEDLDDECARMLVSIANPSRHDPGKGLEFGSPTIQHPRQVLIACHVDHPCSLTTIPGAVIALRFDWADWSAWREPEVQGAAGPPGYGDLEVGEPGVDEDGVLAAQAERADDAARG